MNNYKLIIKDKDLFDLFFNKVPYIWSELDSSLKNDETYQLNCLYKESVRVIQAVEKFVDDLKSGNLPQVAQLQINVTGHAEFDGTFLTYFNKLKFERKMFDMTCLALGLNWGYFQKFLEVDAVKLRSDTSGIEKVLLNSAGSQEWRQQWSPSKFPHKKIYRLNNFFSDLQKNPLYIEEKDKQAQQVENKINDAFTHFDTLLSLHQEVYILVLDVRFACIANQSLGPLIEQVLGDRADIQKVIFQWIPGLLRAYTKLEHDYQNGLKLSCIFILRRLNIDQEDGIAAHLQASLRQNFPHYDAINVINGNRFVQTHGNKSAVGRVGIKQSKKVEQFKYWVLSYFFKMDSFAKLIHPEKTFEVNEDFDGQNWQLPEINNRARSAKKSLPPRTLEHVLQEWKVPKGIWDVKHLAKRVADRLLVGQIYYKEFCTEQGFPEQDGVWLFQIEVFIETLLHNQNPAFNEVRSSHLSNFLNSRDLQTAATQLGQQYLLLVKHFACDFYFSGRINNLIQNRGLRTWWFGHEDNLRLWEDFQQNFVGFMFNQSVDSVVLDQLNINLQNLRNYFSTKKDAEVDKRQILEKQYAQYAQCVRRQTDTREYLNRVLEQNCWAYRITVDAHSSNGGLEQLEFSKLFTEFMRLAKRAKPCYWLRGYVGIWEEKNRLGKQEFILDVVLFFNDRCQEQLLTVVDDLNQRWSNFLATKAVQTLKLHDAENIKYFGSIESKILMRSIDGLNTEYQAQYVCLEACNRKMKNLVIEHVLPYFAYRDIFQAKLSQKVPKAFIKGAMPKK